MGQSYITKTQLATNVEGMQLPKVCAVGNIVRHGRLGSLRLQEPLDLSEKQEKASTCYNNQLIC